MQRLDRIKIAASKNALLILFLMFLASSALSEARKPYSEGSSIDEKQAQECLRLDAQISNMKPPLKSATDKMKEIYEEIFSLKSEMTSLQSRVEELIAKGELTEVEANEGASKQDKYNELAAQSNQLVMEYRELEYEHDDQLKQYNILVGKYKYDCANKEYVVGNIFDKIADPMNSYPFDTPLSKLFEIGVSDGKHPELIMEASYRCSGIFKFLNNTGYLEGEGLLDDAGKYFNTFYEVAFHQSTKNKDGSWSSDQGVDNLTEEYIKGYESVFDAETQDRYQAYGKWIKATGTTAESLNDSNHPFTIDKDACFSWGKSLTELLNKIRKDN